MNSLYTFVYRGVLTDESLDKAGRQSRARMGSPDLERIRSALAFELLDPDLITIANEMATIYTAVHAFENSVRLFVSAGMVEEFNEEWWNNVLERIRKKVDNRMREETRFRWHGTRGRTEIEYCDFGDLSSIIVTNWEVFEDVLVDVAWVKAVLSVLERSRNCIMHGGVLARQDIERIGMNIRDWIRQAG